MANQANGKPEKPRKRHLQSTAYSASTAPDEAVRAARAGRLRFYSAVQSTGGGSPYFLCARAQPYGRIFVRRKLEPAIGGVANHGQVATAGRPKHASRFGKQVNKRAHNIFKLLCAELLDATNIKRRSSILLLPSLHEHIYHVPTHPVIRHLFLTLLGLAKQRLRTHLDRFIVNKMTAL